MLGVAGLAEFVLRHRWPTPDEIRAKAASAVAILVDDPTAGRQLWNRAEVVARLLGAGVQP